MRYALLLASIVSLALAMPTAVVAQDPDVPVFAGKAPPPPKVTYRETPKTMVVPNTTVQVVVGNEHGYDFFRYGVYWYIYNQGHWYRARKHQGPFTVVEAKYGPRAIINVPPRYWKNQPPTGATKRIKRGDEESVVERQD